MNKDKQLASQPSGLIVFIEGTYAVVPNLFQILRLVALGLVVSALLLAWFRAGSTALNPLTGYKLWPKESRRQFLWGLLLLGIIELINWIT